jgi:hypothetical protein
MGQAHLATGSPREVSRPPQAIHALSQSSVPSDEGDALLLAALSSSSVAHCFMCGGKDHVVLACPHYVNLPTNAFARRLPLHLLSDPLKGGQPKAVRVSPKKEVHAIHHDLDPLASDSDDDSVSDAVLPSASPAAPAPDSDFR